MHLAKLAKAITQWQNSSLGVINVGGVAPRGVANVVQAHVASAQVVKLAQNCQAVVYGVSSLDSDQTGDFTIVESVPNSWFWNTLKL